MPDYVATISDMFSRRDDAGLRSYLRARVAHAFAPVLPRAVDDAVVDFDQRTVRGAKEVPPRWKRCLSLTDDDIGDEVGRVFLARHFPAATQTRVGGMVAALRGAARAAHRGGRLARPRSTRPRGRSSRTSSW